MAEMAEVLAEMPLDKRNACFILDYIVQMLNLFSFNKNFPSLYSVCFIFVLMQKRNIGFTLTS